MKQHHFDVIMESVHISKEHKDICTDNYVTFLINIRTLKDPYRTKKGSHVICDEKIFKLFQLYKDQFQIYKIEYCTMFSKAGRYIIKNRVKFDYDVDGSKIPDQHFMPCSSSYRDASEVILISNNKQFITKLKLIMN